MKKGKFRLETYYNQKATETEKEVLSYIINNTREVCKMDIHTLAKKGYCSAATIVRICKKNGFDGFKDLKMSLINDIKFSDELTNENLGKDLNQDLKSLTKNVLNENILSIKNTYNLLDFDELFIIANLIKKSSLVRLFGIGASFLVAKDLQQKFERISKNSVLYEDLHLALISSSNIKSHELAIIISYSGKTKEILDVAKNIKKNNGVLVSITRYDNNKLMQLSDFTISVPVIESSLRIGAASSRISQLCAVDILFNAFISLVREESMDRIRSTKEMLPKEEE